jgi:FtsH-binding integral membrane protein
VTTPSSDQPGDEGVPVPPPPPGPWASDNLPQHPMSYATPPEVEQPPSIRLAVRLMWLGAALSLLGVLLTFTQTDAIRDAIEDSDSSLTSSEVDTAVTVFVAFIVVIGLVGVGLWLWMASANGKGYSWARIVATVLGGLSVVSTLFTISGDGSTGLSIVLSILGVALAVVILVLLWRPDSSRYYELKSR